MSSGKIGPATPVAIATNKGGRGMGAAILAVAGTAAFMAIWIGALFGIMGFVFMAGAGALVGGLWLARRSHQDKVAHHAQAAAEAERRMWFAQFRPEVHTALRRLTDDSLEPVVMWASHGLGRLATNQSPVNLWPQFVSAEPIAIGARVQLLMLDGQSAEHFNAKRDALASSLQVKAIRVIGANRNILTLDLKTRDPLAEMHVSPLLDPHTAKAVEAIAKSGMTDAEQSMAFAELAKTAQITVPVDSLTCDHPIPLLMSEFADWVTINLARGAHGAVQGASRSGKSIFLNSLLAWASLMRDVRVVIIDPNAAAVAPWWRTAYLVCDSTDPDDATDILRQVNKELKDRRDVFWTNRTDRITAFSPEMPLYLLVIDETAEYAKDKKFQAELSRFGAQNAKFGGRGYPSGQKLGEESISTTTRANLFDRICFRVESRHDFAHLFENTKELEAAGLTAADETMPQGVAIVRTRSHPQTCRARAAYLPTELCWAISDAIVAVRGEVRPLPIRNRNKPELPPAAADSKTTAIEAPPQDTPSVDQPEQEDHGLNLPRIPQFGQTGTVIPFDRNRADRAEADEPPATPDADTGTE